ncbi:hypothetical protein [Ruegeria sp. Ofav3-42]|uniref:hypothetical protein n=1 Tax=Ruegeria sp. Ofav3-42 TaxID=2917759 RepID=UPI001EF4A743|nr:hypothetical protein [Ruegeria sp. Ofav3-42]MCG7522688.1 hypothetical protein [Ruegeria sp. Ofav3-42]
MIIPSLPLRRIVFSALITVMPAITQADDVQTQSMIAERVSQHSPTTEAYIKDRPILGWQLNSDDFDAIPEPIRDNLGSVDGTSYDQAYLAENTGSIIALQFRKDGPDFYIIGKNTFDEAYELVPLDDVAAKNKRLIERLDMAPAVKTMFEDQTPGIVGALKTTPVEMLRVSDLGYATSEALTIQAPWGEQSKPEGADAFLVWDSGENQYYMVNADADGLPSSYVPAK